MLSRLCSSLVQWLPSKHMLGVMFLAGSFVLGVILVERGLYGNYSIGYQSLIIVLIITVPGIAFCGVSYLWSYEGASKQHFTGGLWKRKQSIFGCITISLGAIVMCMVYMSSRGLWCVFRTHDHHTLCRTACMLQRTLTAKGIPIWLTLGDLLASHRNRTMPFRWEHDIDLCVSKDHFMTDFTNELRRGVFNPAPIWLAPNHVNFEPVKETGRQGEHMLVDVWECEPEFYGATPAERTRGLNGTFVMVPFCGCMFAAPKLEHRDRIFRKHYGKDYMIQKYDHHSWQCKIWMDS